MYFIELISCLVSYQPSVKKGHLHELKTIPQTVNHTYPGAHPAKQVTFLPQAQGTRPDNGFHPHGLSGGAQLLSSC